MNNKLIIEFQDSPDQLRRSFTLLVKPNPMTGNGKPKTGCNV